VLNTFDLFAIVKQIVAAKAQFRSRAEAWADTGTSTGRLMIAVLGGLADVERDLFRTRTAEGRSRAKAQGQPMGRPRGAEDRLHGDDDDDRQQHPPEIGPSASTHACLGRVRQRFIRRLSSDMKRVYALTPLDPTNPRSGVVLAWRLRSAPLPSGTTPATSLGDRL